MGDQLYHGEAQNPDSLASLRLHWGDAYLINCQDTVYTASRRQCPSALLTADTAAELRKLIRGDYFRSKGSTLQERSST